MKKCACVSTTRSAGSSLRRNPLPRAFPLRRHCCFGAAHARTELHALLVEVARDLGDFLLVRDDDGQLHEADWDTALDRAAEGFARVLDKYGRHAIYGIASGRTPSEANYTMQQFIRRGYGTHYIDNCSRA